MGDDVGGASPVCSIIPEYIAPVWSATYYDAGQRDI